MKKTITSISMDPSDWQFCHDNNVNVSELLRKKIAELKGEPLASLKYEWIPLTERQEMICFYRAKLEEIENNPEMKDDYVRINKILTDMENLEGINRYQKLKNVFRRKNEN